MSAEALTALAAYEPFGAPLGAPPEGARRYLLLDVFSEVPLAGNQLALFLDGRGLEEERMQALARELNIAETVFALPSEQADVRVRIFTPRAELPFAGHPVLGSGAALAGALRRARVVLETGAGAIELAFGTWRGRAANGTMRQPVPRWQRFEQPGALLAALGVAASGLPVEVYENGPRHVYVELGTVAEVAALEPDQGALAALGALGVSCFAVEGLEVRSRMFAPLLGIPEDPATGSAAGPLAVHLARHGRIAFGEQITITQGVEIGRPSKLLARASGTAEEVEEVEVGGSAVIVGRGEFTLPG